MSITPRCRQVACAIQQRNKDQSGSEQHHVPNRNVKSESPNKKNIPAISSNRNIPCVSGVCSYSLPIAI